MNKIETEQAIMRMMDNPPIYLIRGLEQAVGESGILTGLVMQEVEYQFSKHPDGFFMAYEPQKGHLNYVDGENWHKKLGLNPINFKLNFDKIGIRYNSYKELNSAQDKFKGKLYCSYYDPKRKQAYYFRNHSLADATFKEALGDTTIAKFYENQEKGFRKICESGLEKLEQTQQEGVRNFSRLLFEIACTEF